MSRDDLLDFLARALDAGRVTTAEAAAIMDAFEADPSAFPAWLLPLPLALAAPALADLSARPRLTRTLRTQRATVSLRIVDSFDAEAFRAARAYSDTGNVRAWQEAMRDLVGRDLMTQAQLGAGRTLLPSEALAVRREADRQAAYLARFAEEIAAKALRAVVGAGAVWTAAAVYERARQYAGAGRGLFQTLHERGYGPGWRFRWDARDDGGTCTRCASFSGKLYRAGEGPMPGVDCYARGKCRCRRTPVYQPELVGAI